MKVQAQGFGKFVEPEAIKVGDLFTARNDQGGVLCVCFEAKGKRLALLLRAGRPDLAATPTSCPFEDLKPPFARLKGNFAVRPIGPLDGDMIDFEAELTAGSGDLLLSEDDDIYIAVEEQSETLPNSYLVDLISGDFLSKTPKHLVRRSNWELVNRRDNEQAEVLVRYSGDAGLFRDTED